MRWIVGIDYGLRRVGVAAAEEGTTLAEARGIIDRRDDEDVIDRLLIQFAAESIRLFVVGLPLHMRGNEGVMARKARSFGRKLEQRNIAPVAFVDERLSSASAKAMLRKTGWSEAQMRGRVDDKAAVILLESYLAQL